MNVETPSPRKSILAETRHPVQKYGDTPKNVFSRAWQKKYKKKERTKEPIFEHYISPLCRVNRAGPICTIFGR